jgi:hypothetical protein
LVPHLRKTMNNNDRNVTHGKLHELEALAQYLQARIQYELAQRSQLTDKSFDCVREASLKAIEVYQLLSEAKGWNT